MGEGVERKSERDNTCSFLLRNCGKFVVLCLTSETEQTSVHPTHVHALSIIKWILLAFITQLSKVWKHIRQQHWLHVDKVTFRVYIRHFATDPSHYLPHYTMFLHPYH
jgi:hypothetical protein